MSIRLGGKSLIRVYLMLQFGSV